jgi:hypothetical protein
MLFFVVICELGCTVPCDYLWGRLVHTTMELATIILITTEQYHVMYFINYFLFLLLQNSYI